jgi:type VI secretion system protein ImpL
MALLAVLGVIALSVSYGRNRAYVAQIASALAKLRQVPSVEAGASLEALLPRLDGTRAVVDAADRYRGHTPLAMRWGLYQGRSIGNAARDAYVRELDGTLLPRVAARIEKRLTEYAPEPEKLYEYLKAYLMLGEPRHLDKKHLQFIADLEWNAADNASPDASVSLSKHFRSLLEYGDTLRPIALNPSLLAQARSTIRQASIPRIVYSRLKRSHVSDNARAIRLDLAAGVGAEEVIRRRSGVSLAEPISSIYSRTIFQQITRRDMIGLIGQFAADDWVWGQGGVSTRNPLKLAADVTNVYEQDYIASWDAILGDLELVPFSTTSQTISALRILGGPTSPLRGLLAAVVENTALVEPPAAETAKPSGAAGAAKKAITDRLGGLFDQATKGPASAGLPGALITAHFQPIHRLMAGEPGSAPIDRILVLMGQVQQQLESLGPEAGRGNPLNTVSDPGLRQTLQSLRQEAETLPPVIQTMVTQMGRTAAGSVTAGAASELEKLYRREVVRECTDLLAGRYPFTTSSLTDVQLADFVRVLGYGGVFDRFFNDNLEPLVDRSESPWTWRSGAVPGSRAMLDQFEAAERIRELFFRRSSRALDVRFAVTVADIDTSTTRFVLEIDGQGFDYRVPSRSAIAAWPGPNPGTAAVTFEDRSGARPRMAFQGPWAWFRLVEAAQEERESDVRSRLVFHLDGHEGRVIVEAGSARNPFADRTWQGFRCGS